MQNAGVLNQEILINPELYHPWFMQICNLPKGAQKEIHGPVDTVPSNLDTSVTTLPSDAGLVPVKLKRKLQY